MYESLLTERLSRQLESREDLYPEFGSIDDAEQALAIALHLSPIMERSLRSAGSAEKRAEIMRRVLAALLDPDANGETLRLDEGGKVRRLEELRRVTSIAVGRLPRPATPFSDAALMTNARNEPTLAAELRAELASADHVDLLCAFVKWHGLRVLEDQLNELRIRGIPLRVITTTYVGATERLALDALVREFDAEVKIQYDALRTRLHAKAWLFRRRTEFDTAYVGSSNLSRSALLDGVEWNVRLSRVGTPTLLEKFRATFDTYWNDAAFERMTLTEDGDRLDDALAEASGRKQSTRVTISLAGLEVRPFPYQAEMVEQLAAEREIHDRHRNLVVAATGTGKTVLAALDYRNICARERTVRTRRFFSSLIAGKSWTSRCGPTARSLTDANFGELYVGGLAHERWRHVFASDSISHRPTASPSIPGRPVRGRGHRRVPPCRSSDLPPHPRPCPPHRTVGLDRDPRTRGWWMVPTFGPSSGTDGGRARLWEALERIFCVRFITSCGLTAPILDRSLARGGYDRSKA